MAYCIATNGHPNVLVPDTPRPIKRRKPSSKKLSERIKTLTKTINKPLRLFFQDEGRFGRISKLCACWGPKGQRSIVPSQHIREYTYAYAAIEPKTGETVSLILPVANTEAMNLHLAEIASRYPNEHIALVLDGAAWHKSEELLLPENITLLPLPPYSPELNPVEQLWKSMRRKWFFNKFFDTLDEMENHLEEALRWIENTPQWVHSFVGYPWILSAI